MAIRDWFKRKSKTPAPSTPTKSDAPGGYNFVGPTQPSTPSTPTKSDAPGGTSFVGPPAPPKRSGGSSSGSTSPTFGLPEPKETILTEIAKRPPITTPTPSTTSRGVAITGAVRGYQGPESTISAASGKERLTETPFTEKKFKDVSAVPQFGTAVQQFGGYTQEGDEIKVDTGLQTYGQLQVEKDIINIRADLKQEAIQKKYIETAEKELVKDVSGYANKLTQEYQKQLDAGYFTEEQANNLLQKDLELYQTNLLNSKKYKDLERKANEDLQKAGAKRQLPILELFEQPSRKERIIEKAKYVPLIGQAISAVESTGKFFEEGRRVALYESLTGEGASREKLREARKESILDVGLLALDVGLAGAAAKSGIKAARGAIQRELAKGTSLTLEQLGKAKIRGISITKKSTGEFIMRGIQESGKATRQFEVAGKLVRGTTGYSFIPEGEGKSIITGITEANFGKGLKGATKRGFARAIGEPTTEVFGEFSTFGISSAGVSREIPATLGGLTPSRSVGIGVFQPKARTFARATEDSISSLNSQLTSNIELGGSPVVSEFITPAFSVERKGVEISRQVGKQSDILGLLYEPVKKTPTVSFARNEANVRAGRKRFIEGLKRTKPEPKSLDVFDDILGPSKGTKKVFKPQELKQTKTDILTDTLTGGFANARPITKPFSFTKPDRSFFSETLIGRAATGTARGIASGTASKVGRVSASSKVVDSLSKQLSGQVSLSKVQKITQKPSTITPGPLTILPTIPAASGFFIPRPPVRPRIRDSDFGFGQRRASSRVKNKKKQKFKPEQTGFGAALGIKSKAKRGQQFTGFEVLR